MRLKPYPGYKDSGIEWLGEVPEHWKVNRLKLHIKLNPSKKEISHFSKDTELSFIPMDNVGIDGSLVLDTVKPLFEVDSGYTYFREHDVAIAKITPCFENGKGCIFSNLTSGHGFGTTELTVMRPLNINPKYLYYITSSYSFKRIGESSMQGSAGQKRVPDEFIKEFRSPIPSIQEQRSIASFLDHEKARIDTLIQKKEQMIELLKEKRIALITQAVTKGLDPNVKMKDSGIEWLGEVPGHWDIKRLRFCVNLNPSKKQINHFPKEAELSFIPMENVGEDGSIDLCITRPLSEMENGYTFFSDNDVAIAKITPCFENGKGCVFENLMEGHGFGSTELTVMRPIQVSPAFLYYLTVSSFFRSIGEGLMQGSAGQKRVPDDFIRNFFIGLPSKDEQATIVNYIKVQTNLTSNLENITRSSIDLLHEYRSSLIHSAVTGKIDLRGYHEEH